MKPSLPTPGRLLYLGYHLPTAWLGDLIRDGGPRQRRLTEAGRLAMIEAARHLRPLPLPSADAPRIHFLTGARYWHQTAFLLVSLTPHLSCRPVIHDDGTLDGPTIDALFKFCPFADIRRHAATEACLEQLLPALRFPCLRARRNEWVLFRKLLDVHVGESGWNLFLDSDQLCLGHPRLIADWLRSPSAPLHMTDVGDAYGCPPEILDGIAGRPVPRRLNTGILGLHSADIDWSRLEWLCGRLDAIGRPHYYHEQALTALLLADHPERLATPLSDYVVLPSAAEGRTPRAVWHHYVAQSKRWYYQLRWREFATKS
ncbi:MAG: glycosyl transferase family 2 [Opitutaceae bacterium]|jgi:hypothetical protein|nr:glycosyl transferase family 2 [Opitutaceae bacterium]